jgi:hypothetical protein
VTARFVPTSVASGKTATLTVTDGSVVHEAVVDLSGDGLNPGTN